MNIMQNSVTVLIYLTIISDFREFLTSLSIQQKGTFPEKLNWAFDLYDLDNSGNISKSELTGMITVGISHKYEGGTYCVNCVVKV